MASEPKKPTIGYPSAPAGVRRAKPDVGLSIVGALCGIIVGGFVAELVKGVGGRGASAVARHTALHDSAFVEGCGKSDLALLILAGFGCAGCFLARRVTGRRS